MLRIANRFARRDAALAQREIPIPQHQPPLRPGALNGQVVDERRSRERAGEMVRHHKIRRVLRFERERVEVAPGSLGVSFEHPDLSLSPQSMPKTPDPSLPPLDERYRNYQPTAPEAHIREEPLAFHIDQEQHMRPRPNRPGPDLHPRRERNHLESQTFERRAKQSVLLEAIPTPPFDHQLPFEGGEIEIDPTAEQDVQILEWDRRHMRRVQGRQRGNRRLSRTGVGDPGEVSVVAEEE